MWITEKTFAELSELLREMAEYIAVMKARAKNGDGKFSATEISDLNAKFESFGKKFSNEASWNSFEELSETEKELSIRYFDLFHSFQLLKINES